MVLVGTQRLLVPGFAAEGEPRPRRRWVAEASDGQLDEAPGEGIDGGPNHMPDVDGVDVGFNQVRGDLREPMGRGHRLGFAGASLDGALQCER
jgi:hypothetical protein